MINQKKPFHFKVELIKQIKSSFRCRLIFFIISIFIIFFLKKYDVQGKVSKISLIIKGKGKQKIIFNIPENPLKVEVNGLIYEKDSLSLTYEYYLENDEENFITIIWDEDVLIEDCSYMFLGLSNIIKIDFSEFDSSHVYFMSYMFYACESLQEINFANFNTSLVIDMSYMFCICDSLKYLDLRMFNTSLLENAVGMFAFLKSLISIDLSSFDASLIKNMSYLFYGCIGLKSLYINHFNTISLQDMRGMFEECQMLESLDLSNFNTTSVKNMDYMFFNCFFLKYLDIHNFNTSLVESMIGMFYYCISLNYLDLNNFETSSVNNMDRMFEGCISLYILKIDNFDILSVTSMNNMFKECRSLESLNLYNFNTLSDKLIDISYIFDFTNESTVFCINEIKGEKLISQLEVVNPIFINNCSKMCSMKSEKFSKEKGKCLNDSIYYNNKYIYNNEYYSSCPKNTYITEDNNYTCYKEPDGYFLDNNIYKPCFPTCKKCNELGDENNNKCMECYDNFILLINSDNYINCYSQCNYYYYLDSKNNIQCTESEKCPIDYNKLIKEINKCIDDCSKDSYYKYDYNDECFYSCPNNTHTTIDNNFICYNEPDGYFLDNNIYKSCYKTCKKCFEFGNDIDHKCIECYSNYILINDLNNFSNCYEICNNYYYFDSKNNYQCTINNECLDEYKLIVEKNKCIKNCSNDDIYIYEFNNKCFKECPQNTFISSKNPYICDINKTNEFALDINQTYFFNKIKDIKNNSESNIDSVIQNIKSDLIKGNLDSLLINIIEGEKKDILINDKNILYQITTSDNQNNENKNISSIKLGECETILKYHYNISINETLLIFKMDYFEEGLLIPIITYEIYNSKTKEKLNLNICKNYKINISIPVNINEDNLFIYNLSSDYYNDICFIFNNENGIDITLNERKKEFNNKNMSLCEKNCEYFGYNIKTKKLLCSCKPKNGIPLISELVINKNKLFNKFVDLKNSLNINIIKCYNILFTKEGLIHNIGSYIILSIYLLNILLLIFFITKGYNLSKNMVNIIMNIKKGKKVKYKKRISLIRKNIIINNNNYNNNINNKDIIFSKLKKGKSINNKKKTVKFKNYPPKKKHKFKRNLIVHIVGINDNNNIKSKRKDEFKNNQNKLIKSINNNQINNISNKSNNIIYFNDYELNSLSYQDALKIDKRTYLEYYFSLLKTKQLIIFSFYTYTDYNSKIIKISLFFFSFALYYTVNALFFTDSTMNKIYETDGDFNFIYQIPQILYSSIISAIINTIIKYLALSEKRIIKLKNEQNVSNKKIKLLLKCFLIKYIFFFSLSFLFLIIFWYYLSCFGVVYKNTQIHLITDTLISFGLTLIYPFGVNLLPGIFRIPSLNPNEKDRELLYKFSKIIQLI